MSTGCITPLYFYTDMYMLDDSVKGFLNSKGAFQVFKSEIIFDIFSTICSHTTNRINQSAEDIFSNKDNVPYDYILALNGAIVDVSLLLNEFLSNHSIMPFSKYFYIYFFYRLFSNKYSCDPYQKVCTLRTNVYFDEEQVLEEIDFVIKEKWFVDENRQLTFFTDKIKNIYHQWYTRIVFNK